MQEVIRHSDDYWLPHTDCPACEKADHGRCDPDRTDCPSLLCECKAEFDLPRQREQR